MTVREEHLSDSVRLICGDCREVLPTLGLESSSGGDRPANGQSQVTSGSSVVKSTSNSRGGVFVAGGPLAVVCDPPYGIAHSGDSSRFSGGQTRRGVGSTHGKIKGDGTPFDPSVCLLGEWQIIFGVNNFPQHLLPGSLLVWAKRRPAAYGTFLSDGEVAWFSKGRGIYLFEHIFAGSAAAVEYCADAYAPSAHPFQKPLAVMEWCLGFIPDARTILDPFMGSGTTGVAAVKLGRAFIGIEIEPKYFDIACRRISEALKQPDMFIEKPKPAKQEDWHERWAKLYAGPLSPR